MILKVVSCDICGMFKKSNNWWLGFKSIRQNAPLVTVLPWDEKLAARKNMNHFCGSAHAHKFVENFVSEQKPKTSLVQAEVFTNEKFLEY